VLLCGKCKLPLTSGSEKWRRAGETPTSEPPETPSPPLPPNCTTDGNHRVAPSVLYAKCSGTAADVAVRHIRCGAYKSAALEEQRKNHSTY